MDQDHEQEKNVFALGDDDFQITLINYLDADEFVRSATNSTRLVNKLKAAVQANLLYETQQILRTVYFRFINYPDKVKPLVNLLYYGALHLIKRDEFISGLDIATLFLEAAAKRLQCRFDDSPESSSSSQVLLRTSVVYHKSNKTFDIEICQKVSHIMVHLPDNEVGQAKFIAEALRLLTPKILNRDLLHNVLAISYWQLNHYVNARYHFLHCANKDNAQDVAHLLVGFHVKKGLKSEVDLFITQFILQFLCLQSPLDSPMGERHQGHHQPNSSNISPSNLTVSRKSRNTIKIIAEKIFSEYTLKHPSLGKIEIPFESMPLLNLTYFIISTLDSNKSKANAYKLLLNVYKVACMRDPNYQSYLNRIGIIYFGLVDQAKQQQQNGGGGNFFNNVIMSLLDGTDEDEEDETLSERQAMSCDEPD